MKNHSNCIRGYHRSSKAYYSSVLDNIEVNFGFYNQEDGSTSGEMRMVWVDLSPKNNEQISLTPKLVCFDDGWSALSNFTDVIEKLGQVDNENITEEKFCNILNECGFSDLTAYTNPNIKYDEMITVDISKEKAEKLGLI